jgi:cobalt-zinc-cadmium efflux system outer membrane protein
VLPGVVSLLLVVPLCIGAQSPGASLTRAAAIDAALGRGARLVVARADTSMATALLLSARTFENPTLSASYTKDAPRYHVAVGLPLDYAWVRALRIRSARAGREAASLRFRYERALVAFEADTTYTRALAALARTRLSERNALDADSLRRIAVARRDAGDASDLEVELATLNAGQQANIAAGDSLVLLSTLLNLQMLLGVVDERAVITPVDSLTLLPVVAMQSADTAVTLPVAAAQRALDAAEIDIRVQRRSVLAATSIEAGFETGGPTTDDHSILPTFGIAFPLPLLNRNRGLTAVAEADRERARAELQLATLESATRIAQATRELTSAMAKVERDRALVVSANRIASLSIVAYREGASSITTVLEAQRNARDVLGQYIDDLAAFWIAAASLRVFGLTPATDGPS